MPRRIRLRPTAVYTPPVSPPPSGGFDGVAELPRENVTTTFSMPSGNVWTATQSDSTASPIAGTGDGNRTGCGFQYALNNCARGDVIELSAGVTYTGTFVLRYKASGLGWVYIRTSSYASLPTLTEAYGAWVTPGSHASLMPTVRSPSSTNLYALQTEPQASFYRFVGVRFTMHPSQVGTYVLVGIGGIFADSVHPPDSTTATLPTDITFDRCIFDSDILDAEIGSTGNKRYCVHQLQMNCIRGAVVGCYFQGAWTSDNAGNSDSQAFYCGNAPGPYKIQGNYIGDGTENLIFGGTVPNIANCVPSDITIRYNQFSKRPAIWAYSPTVNLKNAFELKNARRVLIEYNLFTDSWPPSQSGYAIVFTPRTNDANPNAGPWITVQDVTFRNNRVKDCGAGINMTGRDDPPTLTTQAARFSIHDNWITCTKTGPSGRTGSGKILTMQGEPESVEIRNNHFETFLGPDSSYIAYIGNTGDDMPGFVFENNIAWPSDYGVFGQSLSDGKPSLDAICPQGYTFRRNVLVGTWPPRYSNVLDVASPATLSAVGFIDLAGGNYRLASGSAYKGYGFDGTDPGCDFDLVAT